MLKLLAVPVALVVMGFRWMTGYYDPDTGEPLYASVRHWLRGERMSRFQPF